MKSEHVEVGRSTRIYIFFLKKKNIFKKNWESFPCLFSQRKTPPFLVEIYCTYTQLYIYFLRKSPDLFLRDSSTLDRTDGQGVKGGGT